MMNSTRSRTRVGGLQTFCRCCRIEVTNTTQRAREKRAWKREVSNL